MQNSSIKIGQKLLEFTDNLVMGILNVTPDSFYSNSRIVSESELLIRTEKMLSEGADILDIGGYSSRPGASEVPENVEIERILNAVISIRKNFPEAIISLDTFRSKVARAGLDAGVNIINDISAGDLDKEMPKVVKEFGVPYIIMHMKGSPQTMNSLSSYDNLMKEIFCFFTAKLKSLRALEISDIIIDPGFGFAKTMEQNYQMIQNFDMFHELDCPILVGISRKSFIQKKLNLTAENSLVATSILHSILLQKGASIIRTHDVAEAKHGVNLMRICSNNG